METFCAYILPIFWVAAIIIHILNGKRKFKFDVKVHFSVFLVAVIFFACFTFYLFMNPEDGESLPMWKGVCGFVGFMTFHYFPAAFFSLAERKLLQITDEVILKKNTSILKQHSCL